jgi:hypothetical protein
LPLLLTVIGIVLIVIGHAHYKSLVADRRSLESAAGVALLVIALSIWLINWMLRMSVESTHDREQEELAREEFSRTGHWPDERDGSSRP